jgi:hypothetical protein
MCPSSPVNPDPNNCTVCNGDTECNIWWEPGPPGFPGKCKLDHLTYEDVYWILSKVPQAKADLLRITTDECLIRLANTTKLIVPEKEANQLVAKRLHKNSLPYYTLFKGNVDGTVYK